MEHKQIPRFQAGSQILGVSLYLEFENILEDLQSKVFLQPFPNFTNCVIISN